MSLRRRTSLRRYLAVIQDARGYPASDEPLPAPPEGPIQPLIVSVVKADEHDAEVEMLRAALAEAYRRNALVVAGACDEVSAGVGGDSATGPYLYVERGGFMLHLYLRWFTLPWQHGLYWGCTLRARGRYLFSRSRI
jgi:hypothetical protein